MADKKHKAEKVAEKAAEKQKSAKSDKKNTSLRLEKKTLKALKMRAIEEETSVQKLVERLINDYLNI